MHEEQEKALFGLQFLAKKRNSKSIKAKIEFGF